MAAPTIAAVSPSTGVSRGETYVRITGTGFNLVAVGSVRVEFGGIEATEVGVISATELYCLTPRATALGAVDVVVTNVTPDPPNPDIEEAATATDAYTYTRPSLASPPDFSNHPLVSLVIRQLLADLQLHVLQNTAHDMHPEYANAVDAAVPQEHQSSAPSLKLMGPTVVEDAFYSPRGHPVSDLSASGSPKSFDQYHEPIAVRLTFDLIGIGKTPVEATNLWLAAVAYFKFTPYLVVSFGGESVEIEMQPTWEQRGDYRTVATRQGIYQFTMQAQLRGILIFFGKRYEGAEVLDTPITTSELP